MRKRDLALVSRPEQLAALVSPLRQELLDVLARLGPVSLAELGAVLGRPSDGLYYHVRALVRVGLVRPAGTRVRGGRSEGLFAAIASQFALRYAAAPAPARRALTDIVAAMMRLGTRDYRRALGGDGVRVEGPERDLWALRTTGWLRPADVRRVNRLIQRLSDAASRATPRGRLYAVTVLLAPLTHRDNTTGRRPRKGTRR